MTTVEEKQRTQAITESCRKLYRHRNYIEKMKEVLTIDNLMANMDFLPAIYALDNYLVSEIKQLRN